MAESSKQLCNIAAQSESSHDALEPAHQRAAAATAACGNFGEPNVGANSRSILEEDARLVVLGKRWRLLQKDSLELRLQIGKSVNDTLGRPTTGRNGCQKAFKEVADKIGCAVPDVYMMSSFAAQFPSVDDFEAPHPATDSWNKVKQVVAGMNPNRRARKRSTFGSLIRLVKRLTSQHAEGNLAFEQKEVRKLLAILIKFAMALDASPAETVAIPSEQRPKD